jgi:hypothetical protein
LVISFYLVAVYGNLIVAELGLELDAQTVLDAQTLFFRLPEKAYLFSGPVVCESELI